MGSLVGGDHFEKTWTKASIFKHFGVLGNKAYADTKQVASGFVMLRKTQKTQMIIQEWLDIFYNHFELVDDSPSPIPNDLSFIENRHDQSIWSMLNKKYGMVNFDDIDFPHKGVEPKKHPIVVTRNKIYLDYNLNYSELQHLKEQKSKFKQLIPIFTILGKLHPISATRKSARFLKSFLLSI